MSPAETPAYSEAAQPRAIALPEVRTLSLPVFGRGPLFAFRAAMSPDARWIVAPGNVALLSSAATARVRELDAGVPAM